MLTDINKKINFIDGLENLTESLNDQNPRWVNDLRKQGLARFVELGVPTTKNEEWKYTNITPITQRKFQLPKEGKLHASEEFNRYRDSKEINIVFVNGIFAPQLSNLKKLNGITIKTVQQAIKDNDPDLEDLLTRYDPDQDTSFVALNQALANDGAYISVGNKAISKELIHIIHITDAGTNEIVTAGRCLITVGKSSEATILESHITFSDEAAYLANPLTDIFIAENSTLNYCKAQKESAKAYHINNTRVWQQRDSNLNGFTLVAGGLLTRNNLDVILDGEGSNGMINGLYCVNGHEFVDNHTTVDHRVPNCTSNQLYKGILNGSSHAVFNGKIFVRPIAQKTNSYQLNKNLLLGKNCVIDTKPQLEIFADDVKCTHGATIGQLNEDEIFYLETRAIYRKTAITMLARGFVNDILAKINNDSIIKKANILLEPTFKALKL